LDFSEWVQVLVGYRTIMMGVFGLKQTFGSRVLHIPILGKNKKRLKIALF
jgi:hypothetical protein